MAARRLTKELREFPAIDGITVTLNGDDLHSWTAQIEGPPNSPYAGRVYHLALRFPPDYPFKQPKLQFCSKIYHPNVHENGDVCCCFFEGKMPWSPRIMVKDVLIGIRDLLGAPADNVCGYIEAADLFRDNKDQFNKRAREWAARYAEPVRARTTARPTTPTTTTTTTTPPTTPITPIPATPTVTPTTPTTPTTTSTASNEGEKEVEEVRGIPVHVTWDCIVSNELLDASPIGFGSFGVVNRCKYKGAPVAVKRLFGVSEVEFIRELKVMASLHCPYLVQFIGANVEERMIVMELMSSGSVKDLLVLRDNQKDHPDCTVQKMRGYAIDIALGLAYMHGRGLIHRDLKPANILLDRGRAKLADFGLSRLLTAEMTAGTGTFAYMAPEMYEDNGTYGCAIDIFSFGLVLYDLFVARNPFSIAAPHLCAIKICRGERPPFPLEITIAAEIKGLIERCWSADPQARPSILEILDILDAWRP